MRPERAEPVRELARITGVSPETLHRTLNALVDQGLLLRQQEGIQVSYRANPDCAMTPELTGLIRQTAGVVDVLRASPAPIADRIDAIFVYGSMASGDVHARSDIDLIIIGHASLEKWYLRWMLRKALRGHANPTIFSAKKSGNDANAGRFCHRCLEETKLWLTGNMSEHG